MRTQLQSRPLALSTPPARKTPTGRARFEEGPDFVQSLARGLAVIRAFDGVHPALSLSEVSERTGLARAAARRSLRTLEHLGYVSSRGRAFSLSPRVLELGFGYLASLALPELALPFMEQLAQRVGESCSLAVLDGAEIVYVARVPVRRVMTISLGVGARLPAFAASMGRVLLAGLSDEALDDWLARAKTRALTPHTTFEKRALRAEILRVRAQGHALVLQELEIGLCSVAVPVRDRQGRVVAALNVGMQYREGSRRRAIHEILPALEVARRAIESGAAPVWAVKGAER
jgi:IclR family pca regulon transcriptional regulator